MAGYGLSGNPHQDPDAGRTCLFCAGQDRPGRPAVQVPQVPHDDDGAPRLIGDRRRRQPDHGAGKSYEV